MIEYLPLNMSWFVTDLVAESWAVGDLEMVLTQKLTLEVRRSRPSSPRLAELACGTV